MKKDLKFIVENASKNFLNQILLHGFYLLIKKNYFFRASAEEAIRVLNGSQLGGQSIRLSWGRSPANKQVTFFYLICVPFT
jgi:hypothetical protein